VKASAEAKAFEVILKKMEEKVPDDDKLQNDFRTRYEYFYRKKIHVDFESRGRVIMIVMIVAAIPSFALEQSVRLT